MSSPSIWSPITLFAFPLHPHEGRDRQFFAFYTMTLASWRGGHGQEFCELYMFFEMMEPHPPCPWCSTAARRPPAGGLSVSGLLGCSGTAWPWRAISRAYYMATTDFIHGGGHRPGQGRSVHGPCCSSSTS